MPAQYLYCSRLFELSRELATRCKAWAILSAKLHLVEPGKLIAPYELQLARVGKDARERWAEKTRKQIDARFPGERFLLLAGKMYAAALEGLDFVNPLEGLGIGYRLQKLKGLIE